MAGDERDYMRAENDWKNSIGGFSPLVWLVVVNVVVFVVQHIVIGVDENSVPAGGFEAKHLASGKIWTLLSYMFVHHSHLHLGINLLIIYFAGKMVLKHLGLVHFLWIYFLGGVSGALLQALFDRESYLIGASAGGYALFIAAVLMLPDEPVRFRFPPIRIRPRYFAYGAIGMTLFFLVLGFAIPHDPNKPEAASMAHLAHLGGIVVGWYYLRIRGLEFRPISIEELQADRQEREGYGYGSTSYESSYGGSGYADEDGPKETWLEGVSKRRSRQTEEPQTPTSTDDGSISSAVDDILDKVNEKGFQSLTAEERKILDKASSNMK